MSSNTFEFQNIRDKDLDYELNLKPDVNLLTSEDFSKGGATKCGDVFVCKWGNFIFCCYFCDERFNDIQNYTCHVEETHLKILITNEMNSTQTFSGNDFLSLHDNEFHISGNIKDSSSDVPDKDLTEVWNSQGEDNTTEDPLLASIEDPFSSIETEDQTMLSENDCLNVDTATTPTSKFSKSRKGNKESQQEVNKSTVTRKGCEIEPILDQAGKIICPICSKSFPARQNFRQHVRVHTGEKPFSCPHCSYTCAQKQNLNVHVRRSHLKQKPFPCAMCDMRFVTTSERTIHQRYHTDERPFQCEICERTFTSSGALTTHKYGHSTFENKQKKMVSKKPTVPKILIDVSKNNEPEASSEKRNRIESEPLLDVMKIISSPTEIVPVNPTHTDNSNKSDPKRSSECPYCFKTFSVSNYLQMHIRIHTGERPYGCPNCNLKFSQKQYLVVHMRRAHLNQKPYSCDHCDKRFVTATEKVVHQRYHTNERPYKCQICEQSFASSGALNTHRLKTHTKETPFKCQHCSAVFSRKQNYGTHLKIHSGAPQFVCEICKKAFPQQSNLNFHLRTHWNIRTNMLATNGMQKSNNGDLEEKLD